MSILMETQPSLRLNEVSVDSSGHPFTPLGLTQAKAHARNKPRFVEFACSHLEVFRYVALVTKAVIPMGFWGTKSNFHHILKGKIALPSALLIDSRVVVVKRFITCRRYESISVHYMLQGFSTADCDWLAPPGEKARAQKRVSVSDSLKRRELLEEFVFWYLDSFVMPLLKVSIDSSHLIIPAKMHPFRQHSTSQTVQHSGIKSSIFVKMIGRNCVNP